MNNEKLDLTPFGKALITLKRALDEFDKDHTNEFVRDACIQRFEYSYDLATKMILRHLKNTEDDPSSIEAMTAQDRIRRAYELGILRNSWDSWWEYRNDRAATSHGYDADRANAIVEKIPGFYSEAQHLFNALEAFYETEV
jgi:nucleotidyltransferase substrate binding protein (TIGR01987 family)